jgi:pSer/pThr/pTyr-binding forkhead associated (FHA) protein
MRASLISLSGHSSITLETTLTLIGRDPACDVRIGSLRVSRCHCCLALESEGAVVRDLKSTNGTRINGAQVASGHLRAGDELAIAHLRYRLRIEEPASGPTQRRNDGPPGGDSPNGEEAAALETRLEIELAPGPDQPSSHA